MTTHTNSQDIQRIRFEKPDLAAMTQDFTVVDLHFHSCHSDGSNSIDEIADRAGQLNIGIAVTDHNEITGALELDRYREILSIPGIEITSREGAHVLVYFYDIDSLQRFYEQDIQPFMGPNVMSATLLTMEEIVERARGYRCLVIFPHPNCAVYTGICNPYFSEDRQQQLFARADGVEVINSGNLKKQNLKCALLGFNLNKAITGGSDGHRVNHMGAVVSYADCPPDRVTFLEAVRMRRVKVIGKEIDLIRKVASNGSKIRCGLQNCSSLLEKNLHFGCTLVHSKSKRLREKLARGVNGGFGRRLKARLYHYDF